MKHYRRLLLLLIVFLLMPVAYAEVTVPMYLTAKTGMGKSVGTIELQDSKNGLLITPHLYGLTPGIHGIHVHENPSCADDGAAAGGHLDPMHTGKHLGPYNKKGHLGDLPRLIVDKQGNATTQMLAPRLKLTDVQGHAIIIHAGGDNYSDSPKKLGGGGARIACGIIPN